MDISRVSALALPETERFSRLLPRVTILLPLFNGEKYIDDALTSARGQTEDQIEIIVVDDGSTDRSREIAEGHAASDPRVRVFSKPNGGTSEARNYGLSKARAPYVALLDHDDVFLPTRIELGAAFLDNNPDVAVVGSYGYRIGATGREIGVFDVGPNSKEHFKRLRDADQVIFLLAASVTFRRDVVLGLGGFRSEQDGIEDVDLWTRVSDDHIVIALPERLVKYRVHAESVSSRKLFQQLDSLERLQMNTALRRRGELELTAEEFRRRLDAQGPLRRLRRALNRRSRFSYRMAGGLLADKNPVGVAWLLLAALLDPSVPVSRLRRQLGSRLSSRKG